MAYLLLAGLATPLVLSVHTIVSFDFSGRRYSGLARNDFSALLCGRSHLRRLRDGPVVDYPVAKTLWDWKTSFTMRHMQQHGQGDARERV